MKKYISLSLLAVFMLCFAVVSAETSGTQNNTYNKPLPEVRIKPLQKTEPGPGEMWYNGKIKSIEDVRKHEEYLKLQAQKDQKKEFLTNTGDKKPPTPDKYLLERDPVKSQEPLTDKEREALKKRILAEQEAFRAKLKEKIGEFNAEVKAKKEEFKNTTIEKKREFWNGVQNMLGQRFDSAVTNLERMQDRVGDLIEKMDDEGKDMDEAEEYLADSKEKLADAKKKLAEVRSSLPDSGEKLSAEAFEKIKLAAREAKDLLKESHNALVQAIREVKENRENNN